MNMKKCILLVVLLLMGLGVSARNWRSNVYFKEGYVPNISLGGAASIAKGGSSQGAVLTVSTSHGYSFGQGTYVGGGLEVFTDMSGNDFAFPLFGEVKHSFMDNVISPFVGMRSGVVFMKDDGFGLLISPAVGVDICHISFSLSYAFDSGRFSEEVHKYPHPTEYNRYGYSRHLLKFTVSYAF